MSSKHIPIEELKKDLEVRVNFFDKDFLFKTTWGLFSPEKIDEGTIAILNAIESADTESILDIGCGYGPLGIILGHRFGSKKIHMIDKDFVAVEYAKKNSKLNNLETRCYLSNGFSLVPKSEKFDLIVSNLPAKVSKEFFWILFAEAKEHLNPGGRFVVVTIAGLEFFIKKNFESVFGNYHLLGNSKNYFIAQAFFDNK